MFRYDISNFVGIFDNALPDSLCDNFIQKFEEASILGVSTNRQIQQPGLPQIMKENDFFHIVDRFHDTSSFNILNHPLVDEFCKNTWDAYHLYADKYGILRSMSKHTFVYDFKIQKNIPGKGYHMWHCEHDSRFMSSRLLSIIGYLNDVEEGGETEFLYQSIRVKPKKGTLLIAPSSFTHTHRGNPPLKGDKYIITSHMEFIE